MKREIEKRKKIEAAAAIIAVVLALFIVGTGPAIVADDDPRIPVYDGDVTITLNATDDYSGVARTYYAVDPASEPIDWTEYNEPFVVSEPGSHTVVFYSVDNAGNIEDPPGETTFVIYEDTTPPVTSVELQGELH